MMATIVRLIKRLRRVPPVTMGWVLLILMTTWLWAGAALADPFAYVTQPDLGIISVIDVATGDVSATIPVGTMPRMVAVSPAGNQGYVADFEASAVGVINTATNTVTTTIPVNGVLADIAITPDGSRAYAIDSGVSVIDTASNTVIAEIPIGGDPYGVAIAPDGQTVYVTRLNGDVLVINTATNTVVATISVGGAPKDLVVTPDGATVYVTSTDDDTVAVIDTETNLLSTRIPVGDMSYGIVITPDGTRLYVTSAAGIVVIDSATNSIIESIPGPLATDVAVTSDGAAVYVIEPSTNRVTVIDTATNTVTDSIPISNPWGVAITPGDIGNLPSGSGDASADLTGTLTKIKHTVKATGDSLVAQVTIRNEGRALPGGPFVVSLWSSDDDVLGVNDTLLTELEVDPRRLAPGGTTSVKLKVTDVASLDGSIGIIRIDERNAISESDEDNNLVIQQIGGRGCTKDITLLENEPNDDPDQAQRVSGKLKPGHCRTINGFADSARSDFDGYRIRLKGDQRIELTLTHDAQADFDLAVFEAGPSAQQVVTCVTNANPEVCSFTMTNLPDTVTPFDIVVEPFEGASSYTLDIFSFDASGDP